MKRYIKPNTDIHNIEVVVMQATSPKVVNQDATQDGNGDYNDNAKINSFSNSQTLWDEEE